MVFYLKYRPKKISELDSELLRERLEAVLKGKLPDNIPHAFLFTGPRGLGKTSTARILAKTINCTKRPVDGIEPCNKCDSCVSINSGSSMDVMEIDAASNRGIDEIRDLREKIRLAPFSSKKKVYIIDEVHMLTTEAFNALLKTLEEPPSHAIFILCTTEPQKLPLTIISRCFHIKFTKATEADLISSFQRIIKGEGMKASREVLAIVSGLSDGSFREGSKILEELSTSSLDITPELIEKKYKTKSISGYIKDLMESFEKRDIKKGIGVVGELAREGVDFKLFTEEIINELHKSLIAKVNGEVSGLTLPETKKLIELLAGAHMSVKYAILPQLPIELTIVEWCSLGEISESLDLASQGETLQSTLQSKAKENKAASTASFGESKHDKILKDLIERIKSENFSIAGVLRGCAVSKFDEKELVLSTGFKFHKEKLSEAKTVGLIENLLLQISGKKIKFSVILKE